LKHLNASGRWPSGNVRYYYRPPGRKGIPLPDAPKNSPEFLRAYQDAFDGRTQPKQRVVSGTIRAGVVAYLSSDIYLAKADSTRQVERRFADEIMEKYGRGTLATLRAKHIRLALADHDAHPANNRLRLWRAMGRFWVDRGLIDVDPARDVRIRPTEAAQGAEPWTAADFATFRAAWPVGTPQRLCFELLYQTCAAIVDVVQMGRTNMTGAGILYTRQKSKTLALSPLTDPPPWFEASPHFWECIEAADKHMTFLTTKAGASRSHKSVSQWFSKACTGAGLPHLSAHGVRKGRAAIFKENGATVEQRMAILGHETEQEARGYSKSADLEKVIRGTESSNSHNSWKTAQKSR